MPIPRKIAGRLISTIEPLTGAISVPRVVLDSPTHLERGWSLSQRERPRPAVGWTAAGAVVSRATVGIPLDGAEQERLVDAKQLYPRSGSCRGEVAGSGAANGGRMDEKDLLGRI